MQHKVSQTIKLVDNYTKSNKSLTHVATNEN